MKKITILFVLIAIIFFSCKKEKIVKQDNHPKIDTISVSGQISKLENDSLQYSKKKSELFLANIQKIKILEFHKDFIETSISDSLSCKKWNLKKEDILQIIKTTKKISKQELHYAFEMETCVYNGKINYNNKPYDFTINSGGFIYLKYNDLLLGCYTGDCTKYFLSTGTSEE